LGGKIFSGNLRNLDNRQKNQPPLQERLMATHSLEKRSDLAIPNLELQNIVPYSCESVNKDRSWTAGDSNPLLSSSKLGTGPAAAHDNSTILTNS